MEHRTRVGAHPALLGVAPGRASRGRLTGKVALERRPDFIDVEICDVVGAAKDAAGHETSTEFEQCSAHQANRQALRVEDVLFPYRMHPLCHGE